MIDLKEWCEKNSAIKSTEELFFNCLRLYKAEEPEEFQETFYTDEDGVTIEFDKVAYEVSLPEYDQEFIAVYLTVYVNGNKVGWFKNMFNVDGTQFDEFFVIE